MRWHIVSYLNGVLSSKVQRRWVPFSIKHIFQYLFGRWPLLTSTFRKHVLMKSIFFFVIFFFNVINICRIFFTIRVMSKTDSPIIHAYTIRRLKQSFRLRITYFAINIYVIRSYLRITATDQSRNSIHSCDVRRYANGQ